MLQCNITLVARFFCALADAKPHLFRQRHGLPAAPNPVLHIGLAKQHIERFLTGVGVGGSGRRVIEVE
jgi:hypothetical protein